MVGRIAQVGVWRWREVLRAVAVRVRLESRPCRVRVAAALAVQAQTAQKEAILSFQLLHLQAVVTEAAVIALWGQVLVGRAGLVGVEVLGT